MKDTYYFTYAVREHDREHWQEAEIEIEAATTEQAHELATQAIRDRNYKQYCPERVFRVSKGFIGF